MSDPTELTLAAAADAIRSRRLSPVELTEAYLARIERLEPRLNAYITVTAGRGREDARRAEAEVAAGEYRGPLHGIPFGLKDLFETAGIRTTAGSKILGDHVPAADGTVAARLRAAGAVLLGKQNLHEFAYGATSENPHYGPVHNPWALDHIPGGSSGGSAAAIVARTALATMGTDTAGSIRIPAALSGCVGLKPTRGRVSKRGVIPLSWTLDHAGPITRTVEDAAIVLEAVSGYDPGDSSSVRIPVPSYRDGIGGGGKGLRIGVPRAFYFDPLHDEVRAAVEAAIQVFRDLGGTVRDVDGLDFEPFVEARVLVQRAEAQHYHERWFRERPGDYGASVAERLAARTPGGLELVAAHRALAAYTESVRSVLEEVDLLLTPTMAGPAPKIGAGALDCGRESMPVGVGLVRLTQPFNATGLPALSVPCGFTRDGLPIGLQLAGRDFDEATVLRAGHAYEQATEWHLRRPVL